MIIWNIIETIVFYFQIMWLITFWQMVNLTDSETSDTFLEATSENFHPTSATLLVNFEAPMENADQLCKENQKIIMNHLL